MREELNEVVVVDAVRTAFGKAGEKGIFWKTRADDLSVSLLKALIKRNPVVEPGMVDDVIWGVTNAALTRGTQLAGPKAMQASDIGEQWPGWRRLRRSQPGHGTDRGNAALAPPQAAPTR